MKGVNSLGYIGCGKSIGGLVTVFGVEPGFGVVECGESTNRRA
jgi:hypothetical protein